MIRIAWISAIFLLTTWLSGCATIAPTTTPTADTTSATKALTWQERAQFLSQLQSWQLNGKIAVQTSQDSGSASLNWSQAHSRYTVSIMGPLGSHSLKLTGAPGTVSVETSDGKHATASSAEELLAREWGFNLPVSYLKYWVRGIPVPGLDATTQFDANHRLALLSQNGWRVEYQSYTTVGNLDLPDKMLITSSALRTKIIIYKWNIAH